MYKGVPVPGMYVMPTLLFTVPDGVIVVRLEK